MVVGTREIVTPTARVQKKKMLSDKVIESHTRKQIVKTQLLIVHFGNLKGRCEIKHPLFKKKQHSKDQQYPGRRRHGGRLGWTKVYKLHMITDIYS